MKQKIDKAFISDHDMFLHQFDKEHDKSVSQQQEADKYQKIYALRDGKSATAHQSFIGMVLSRLLRVFIR